MNEEEIKEQVRKASILIQEYAKANNIPPDILVEAASNLMCKLCLSNKMTVVQMANIYAMLLTNYRIEYEKKYEQ